MGTSPTTSLCLWLASRHFQIRASGTPSLHKGWLVLQQGWKASGQLPPIAIVLADPGCSRNCIKNPVEYWPSKPGRAMSHGLESFWQSRCQYLSSLRENQRKERDSEPCGRVDGGTVGTEDINVVLFLMFHYAFCPMCSDRTILFPLNMKTGGVTLLMALGNLTVSHLPTLEGS